MEIAAFFTAAGTELALIGGALALGLAIERLRPIDPTAGIRTIGFNVAYLPIYVVVGAVLARLAPSPWEGWGQAEQVLLPWPDSPVGVAIASYALLATFDFFYYWVHRLQHSRLLWPLHAFHHSDTHLNVSSRSRSHWLEGPMSYWLAVIPTFAIWPFPPAWLFFIVLNWTFFNHLNCRIPMGPLRFFIVGPVYHRVHHSIDPAHRDRNFCGFVPLWDVLFGTFVDPGRVELDSLRTGVVGHDDWRVRDLLRANVQPIIDTCRLLAGRRPGGAAVRAGPER